MKKKIIAKCSILLLIILNITIITTNVFASTFTDLEETHWAYDDINTMVEKGILNGYPDGTFRPNGYITRAEMAAVLGRYIEKNTYVI